MIKFYLINYRSKATAKSFDQVVIGTLDRVTAFAEAEAYNYNTDFYIEHSRSEWDNLLQEALQDSPHNLINLCN